MLDGRGVSLTIEEWMELKEGMEIFFRDIDVQRSNEETLNTLYKEISKHSDGRKVIKEDRGFIYFVKSETNHFKIGKTTNLKSRMKTLQGASPYKLKLFCSFSADYKSKSEETLHSIFKEFRVTGEWFNITEKMIIDLLKENGIEVKYYE